MTEEASRLRLVPQDTNGVTVGAISEIKPGASQRHGFFSPVPETLLYVPSASSIKNWTSQTLKFVAGPARCRIRSITNPDKPVVGGTVTAIWTAAPMTTRDQPRRKRRH
ncbi:hypothetical protein ACLBOM_28560 [Escherichia coli]